MKRMVSLLLSAAMLLSLSACGGKPNETASSKSASQSLQSSGSVEPSGGIEVEKELFDVVITVPPDFVGEATQEALDASAKEQGIKSIILNEDGSATYTMTKRQHKKMMEDMAKSIHESLEKLVVSGDYPNFTEINTNSNFTNFTIKTTSKELDLSESFSVIAFYMYGGMYAAFSGEAVDNIHVEFINADSGEIISSTDSKDMGK